MRIRVFLALVLVLAISAGANTHAQEAPSATNALPFVSEGANQPVLDTLSPEGVAVEHEGAGHAKKGLPQFDLSTFPRQLFWLTLTFAFLYIVFARNTLPAISRVLENRRERIASDLRAAEDLKKEVERVRTEYEAAIVHARTKAQTVVSIIQGDIKRKTEAREAEFKERADQAVSALEKKIESGRSRVMAELSDLAANLAVDITGRVADVKASASDARNIIERETGKAKAA